MKLSLSGRLIEIQYRYCEMTLPKFMELAYRCGYEAVELRATQITDEITLKQASELRKIADSLGLEVSCITPPNISNDEEGLKRLRRFGEIAKALDCKTVKVWIKDLAWIQRACDLLKPMELVVATQIHTGGPFETIDLCLRSLREINRRNFRILFDPANLFEAGEKYGEDSVKRLGKWIGQLSVQNIREASPEEENAWEYRGRYFTRCLLGDPRGLDYKSVFRGLHAIGFNGYVTLNEPKPKRMSVEEFAKFAAEKLRELMLQS